MSQTRESRPSDVRSLRAMFENQQESTSPDGRGRSPNGHATDGQRPLSKVRSSFVSVEPSQPVAPAAPMDIDIEKTKAQHEKRASTADLRRESFSLDESADSGAIAELRSTMAQETERRASIPAISETIPEAAVEATPALTTPAVEAKDYMAAGDLQQKTNNNAPDDKDTADEGSNLKTMTLPGETVPAENPDKPVSAVQEEPGPMQPSDPKEEATISSSADLEPTDNATPAAPAEDSNTIKPAPVNIPAAFKESAPAVESKASPNTSARRGSVIAPPESPLKARRGSMAPGEASPKARRESVALSSAADSTPKSLRESVLTKEEVPQQPEAASQRSAIVTPEPSEKSEANGAAEEKSKATPTKSEHLSTPAAAKKPQPASTPLRSPAPQKVSTLSPRAPVRKPSRNSMAAATAATQTRTKALEAATAEKKAPASSKPVTTTLPTRGRTKSPTQATKISSRLTAPTASSAAKQDANTPAPKPAASSRPPPTTQRQSRPSMNGSRPAPRPSIARPASGEKKAESRPSSSRAPDDSFLARMMRPTASSANKVHEKVEVKSPPRRTPSVIKKATGPKPKAPKFDKAPAATSAAETKTNGASHSTQPAETEDKPADAAPAATGASTPQPAATTEEASTNADLEATPAFNAETIR